MTHYARKLAQIDWGVLYEQYDGYLLFEDLKEQWRNSFQPDYVLIDSRTGHTDVCGICTRQLPNAVVILFFPNAQNLRGLIKVVSDIRTQRKQPGAKPIELQFVMSNVPDLDDEDRILEERIGSFRQELGFGREATVIHRYDSLSLLNQSIFTKERPRSRLAKEYRDVTSAIMRTQLRGSHRSASIPQRNAASPRYSGKPWSIPRERRSTLGEDRGSSRD